MNLITIVVPTHNELPNIRPLYDRIATVFDRLPEYDFELIFCDDSADATPAEICRLNSVDPRVKIVRLSRKFGQAMAIAAGLQRSRGHAAILMDADLQDPPEAIPRMLELWKAGNEVVYVERTSISNYPGYKLFAFMFYRLMNKMSSVEIPVDAGEFRLLDRRVVDFLKQSSEHTWFLRGLTVWPGYRSAKVQIQRSERLHGTTKYGFWRSALVATDGIVSFSIQPLRFASILGAIIALGSFLLGCAYVIARLLDPSIFGAGWASLFVSVFFLGGVQLMVLGILGEYVGRIFIEVQKRPLYWVDYEVGFASQGLTQAQLVRQTNDAEL